jgi:5-histidylcysteine sulfoxide synthase
MMMIKHPIITTNYYSRRTITSNTSKNIIVPTKYFLSSLATHHEPIITPSENHSPVIKPPTTTTTTNTTKLDWKQNLRGGIENSQLLGERDPKWWFTGKHPMETPGFDKKTNTLRSLRIPRLNSITLQDAEAYFDNTWTLYELLFSSLQGEEAFFRHPDHRLRHPLVFYLNHTAVFYINKFIVASLLTDSIDKKFESQFEIGVDEMRYDDMSKGDKSWPKISEIMDYRRHVYRIVKDVLRRNLNNQNPTTITWDHPLWSFFMGCDHDRIHLETSSQLIREMPLEFLKRPQYWPLPATPSVQTNTTTTITATEVPENYLVPFHSTTVHLGKPRNSDVYGWDNEYGSKQIQVAPFRVSRDHVTNGEFLEFVKDGGYLNKSFWSEDGWGWRRFRNVLRPHFWVQDGPVGSHRYALRTLFEEIKPFPLDWPVIVNYHESQAFCKWKTQQFQVQNKFQNGEDSVRLMSEAEYGVISPIINGSSTDKPDITTIYDGQELESKSGYNLSLANGSERSVNAFPPDGNGIRNGRGNVWNWIQEPIEPLPGFEIHPYYVDFTEPCFDNQHYLIMGGAYISTGNAGASRYNRYHFRPHFLQQAGIRYVVSSSSSNSNKKVDDKQQTQSDYADPKIVEQYVGFHYGQSTFEFANATIFPHLERPDSALNFVGRCGKLVSEACDLYEVEKNSILDVGCAVGGTSLEFARNGFKKVIGIDYSVPFVKTAQEILNTKRFQCYGLDAELLPPIPENVHIQFEFGDALNLNPQWNNNEFDVVFAGNLLCRLSDPQNFLNQLPRITRTGGLVVLVSPYSWLESFTPRNKWFSSIPGEGENGIREEMKKLGFDLVYHQEIPFMIRETLRKYQYVVSHGQIFMNKNRT